MLACFKPLLIKNRRFHYKDENGKYRPVCLPDDVNYRLEYQTKLNQYKEFYSKMPQKFREIHPSTLEPSYQLYVPCGKCPACLARKSMWIKQRLIDTFKGTLFCYYLTLTYQNDFLPKDGQLQKTDLQKFHKRLRSALDEIVRKHHHLPRGSKIPPQLKINIKYFSVGEYGENNHRPHYHCLIYFKDRVPVFSFETKRERDIWTNRWKERSDYDRLFQSCWNLGTVDSSRVLSDTSAINYVSKYVTKPDFRHSKDKYKFIRSLRSRGIGLEYLVNMLSWHASDPLNRMYHIDAEGNRQSLSPYIRGKLAEKGIMYPTAYDSLEYNELVYKRNYSYLSELLNEYNNDPKKYVENLENSRDAFTDRFYKYKDRVRIKSNPVVASNIELGY